MSWAIHFFEEDSIEGRLFYEDGTEYKPKPKYEPKAAAAPIAPPVPALKPQMSLFDFMDADENANAANAKVTEPAGETDEPDDEETDEPNDEEATEPIDKQATEPDDEKEYFDEAEQREILHELAKETDEPNEEQAEPVTATFVKAMPVKVVEQPNGSPLYLRYTELQKRYPDSVIAMRVGDFYEVLGKFAVTIASELRLTLTSRDCGLSERVPMVGFPCHAADNYFPKICANHRLAIVENTDELKLLPKTVREPDVLFDLDTGEVLTEAEMRKFDGDIEEPKDIDDETIFSGQVGLGGLNRFSEVDRLSKSPAAAAAPDPAFLSKLTDLLGTVFIVR